MSWSPPPPPPRVGDPVRASSPPQASRPARRRGPRRRWGILLALALVAFLGWAGWSILVMGSRPSVEPGSWLEISFDGEYPEERPERGGLIAWLSGSPLTHQELTTALRRAADDERIVGVLLRPDMYRGGWAQAQELRAALRTVREQGKPVWAHLSFAGTGAYYLACAADSIAIAPEGNLMVVGLRARMSYLRGTLEKLGIAADFVAIGEYKSAPETYTREGPSEPARRQVERFVDVVYESWLGGLAEARGLSREHMANLVDEGLFDAQSAMAEGLVDRVLDQTELRDRLYPDDSLRVDPLSYLDAEYHGPKASRSSKLALIYATGQIVPGPQRAGSGLMGSQTVVHRLQRARDDSHVKAVVLRIDSPGGSTLASDRIWREVERVRREKPVVVSMGNLAASGGYYIAMSADHIVADPLTLTGSIGVFMGKADLGGLYDKLGIRHEVIARGENAQLFSDLRPFSPEQRALIEMQLQRFYERFVERVAEGRGMSFAQADSVARGRIWSGEDALALGLVDELGTLRNAIEVAKELGGLPLGQRTSVVTYQLERSFYDRLMENLLLQMGIQAVESPLTRMAWVRLLPETLLAFSEALDGTPQFRLPWQLDVE